MDPLFPELDRDGARRGDELRDDGMMRAEAHAASDWLQCAEDAIRYVAERRSYFDTDAVWAVLDDWGVPPPREGRALGPLMKKACGWGWCETVAGATRLSSRPIRHRRPLTVYRSKLHRS